MFFKGGGNFCFKYHFFKEYVIFTLCFLSTSTCCNFDLFMGVFFLFDYGHSGVRLNKTFWSKITFKGIQIFSVTPKPTINIKETTTTTTPMPTITTAMAYVQLVRVVTRAQQPSMTLWG